MFNNTCGVAAINHNIQQRMYTHFIHYVHNSYTDAERMFDFYMLLQTVLKFRPILNKGVQRCGMLLNQRFNTLVILWSYIRMWPLLFIS